MKANEVATAVESWVNEVVTDLEASYPYVSATKGALPDAMIDVQSAVQVEGPDVRFPYSELQQRLLRVFDVQITIMVADASAAEDTLLLQTWGAELQESLLALPTLKDRVQMASPLCTLDFSLPFIQYPDGTRGRQFALSLSVAELIDMDG